MRGRLLALVVGISAALALAFWALTSAGTQDPESDSGKLSTVIAVEYEDHGAYERCYYDAWVQIEDGKIARVKEAAAGVRAAISEGDRVVNLFAE